MSQPIYGHGSTPLPTNTKAARAFWYGRIADEWEQGRASISTGIAGSTYLYYAGHLIATRKGEALTLCTQGYNTMTTRRYLGAVLAEVGWCCVALNGRTVALKGASPRWPNKTELKRLIEAGEAVVVGDDIGTPIPHGGLLPRFELRTEYTGCKIITDRTTGEEVFLQFQDDLEALGDDPCQQVMAEYFNK